jgi:hypothetical protein
MLDGTSGMHTPPEHVLSAVWRRTSKSKAFAGPELPMRTVDIVIQHVFESMGGHSYPPLAPVPCPSDVPWQSVPVPAQLAAPVEPK